MTSGSTREFMALCAIHQHFGRPGTPTDQAWIESLFGHVKTEYPQLLAIRDPAVLRAELAVVREHYNTIRLHQGIGYVTPDDEHQGRGEAIRKARQAGPRASPTTPAFHPPPTPTSSPHPGRETQRTRGTHPQGPPGRASSKPDYTGLPPTANTSRLNPPRSPTMLA